MPVSLCSEGPYEIFVRELVAVDGVDSSEIVLIDSSGCPTDLSIMSPVTKLSKSGNAKKLKATFEAFKFPASNIVQFRALITPCLSSCKPVQCNSISAESGLSREHVSYGRRRKRSAGLEASDSSAFPANISASGAGPIEEESEVVVVGTIKITDAFNFRKTPVDNELISELESDLLSEEDAKFQQYKTKTSKARDARKRVVLEESARKGSFFERNAACTDLVGLIVACCVFLFAQLVLISAWFLMWKRIRMHRHAMARIANQANLHNSMFFASNEGALMNATAGGSPNTPSTHSANSNGHFSANLKYNEMMTKMGASLYDI